MNRKKFLAKSLAAASAIALSYSSCVPAPSEGNASSTTNNVPKILPEGEKYRWKMVTTWPPNFPVLGEGANKFAEWVKTMSGGRIEIKVFGAGELVPALETFDAVSAGTAEMGSAAAYYWAGKAPAAQFFAAVPFGMNAQQLSAWLMSGGGYELWKELYAPFNLVPFLAGNTGVQMGGWFNREINSMKDLKGLKMRIPGLGGSVLEKAGGAAILVAASEIYTSLERGIIDATEWLCPYHDYKMGFHKIAKYYYTPGWHEPGSQLELMVNKRVYESLPEDLQAVIVSASFQLNTWMLAEFDAKNMLYYKKLVEEENVEVRQFPDEVLQKLRIYTQEVIENLVKKDAFSKKVYASYSAFQKEIQIWSKQTEAAFYQKISQ